MFGHAVIEGVNWVITASTALTILLFILFLEQHVPLCFT